MSEPDGINIAEEVARLTVVADRQLRATYARLTPWQKMLVARHPDRPKAMDYIAVMVPESSLPIASGIAQEVEARISEARLAINDIGDTSDDPFAQPC